ncbi:uncharacterized protein LOC142803285 [Rhipicephalus microplus]|uniref:uncharacterized protein LOC142803285 n=1 Tax=Rhipicephalus microplus TaxID=6941 RepID=UPI003F6BB1C3
MIADHHVQSMALHSLTECVHIDRVTVNAGHSAFAVMILSNTQPVFSHFKHVTSLRVSCDLFKERNFADLCAYLSSSSVLTDVEISLCIRRLSMTEAQSRSVPCRLSLALASNTNLCSVVIKGLQLGIGDLAALADAARRSRRLTKFQYTSRTAWDSLVTRRHNVLEDPPFSLDSITCVALAEIQKSTHRNASRVSAAARFVLGERDSMEAVLGLELCHDHPHLRQLVMDGSLGNADEAKAMIEKARKKLRRYSLHKFMRAAGVVAQRVECRPQRDGGLQLSDIGEDVWSLICRYLSVADVAETAEPSVDTDLPTNENQSNSFEDSPTTADVPT